MMAQNCGNLGWPYGNYAPSAPALSLKEQMKTRVAEIERTLLQVDAMTKELAALKTALGGMA